MGAVRDMHLAETLERIKAGGRMCDVNGGGRGHLTPVLFGTYAGNRCAFSVLNLQSVPWGFWWWGGKSSFYRRDAGFWITKLACRLLSPNLSWLEPDCQGCQKSIQYLQAAVVLGVTPGSCHCRAVSQAITQRKGQRKN